MSLQLKVVGEEEIVVKTIMRNKKEIEVPARMTVEQFHAREAIMKQQEKAAKERQAYFALRTEQQKILNKEAEKVRVAVSNFMHNDQATLKRGLELLKQFLEG